MTPQEWQTVKRLFHAALEQAPEGRAPFLDEACAGDPALRQEVESLLSCQGAAESFIEKPAATALASGSDAAAETLVGRRIGPYRLLRPIGHGGMGAVYLAVRDDDAYRKEVAIKVVPDWAESDLLVGRFRHERQILAALDHPNIARLFDGGMTDEGLPYLVMEHVDGMPIDAYCDEGKLSVDERLELFRTVCSAVHYAHQNLVVHRDIKPANILITTDGTPKLLDFGIAKLLGPAPPGQTTTVFPMMTPEYASPEQVRGEPITTASDVYALGVLLYRLLTGERPYRLLTGLLPEIMDAVCEQEPERPSAVVGRAGNVPAIREGDAGRLRRRLAGDLDNIVLRALRKEPLQRYPSVEQLSADIGRHLSGLPVAARRPTLGYRAEKFVRRHRLGVVAGATVFMALLGGIASTAWQARVAQAERARAERRFNDVRRLANSFLFEFHDAVKDLPGSTAARELVVKKALEYLDNLAQEAGGDRSLQRELAAAYEKVGDVQGRPYRASLGNATGAWASYAKALAIRERLAVAGPNDRDLRRDLAASYARMGEMRFLAGDVADAGEMSGKAVAINSALFEEQPSDAKAQRDLASMYSMFSRILAASGDAVRTIETARKALALIEALAAAPSNDGEVRRELAVAYNQIGQSVESVASKELAPLDIHRKALALDEALVSGDPTNTAARYGLVADYASVGDIQAKMGEKAPALANYRQALRVIESLSAGDPANAHYRAVLSSIFARVVAMQVELGGQDLPMGAVMLTPGELKWKPGLVVQLSELVGARTQPGFYVERALLPANFTHYPHSHPDNRTYTVISGILYVGFGDELDQAKLKALPPGSFWTEPANTNHFLTTKDDPVSFQITGTGISGTTFVDPARDPRKTQK